MLALWPLVAENSFIFNAFSVDLNELEASQLLHACILQFIVSNLNFIFGAALTRLCGRNERLQNN